MKNRTFTAAELVDFVKFCISLKIPVENIDDNTFDVYSHYISTKNDEFKQDERMWDDQDDYDFPFDPSYTNDYGN